MKNGATGSHAFHGRDVFENLAGDGPPKTMDQIVNDIAIHPQSPLPYIHRGNALILDGDDAEALRDFDKALKLDPKSAQAHIGRARVMESLQKWNLAFAELQKAKPLATQNTLRNILWESAYYHREIKEYQPGLQEFDALLKMQNLTSLKRAIALFQRAEIYARTGKPDLVLKEMNEVIRIDPLLTNAYKTRARALRLLNRPAQSLPDFNVAIEMEKVNYAKGGGLSSDLVGLLKERASVYDRVGKRDLAAQDRALAQRYERQTLQDTPFRMH